MQEQNSFAWFASQLATVWRTLQNGLGIPCCRRRPEVVLVTLNGQRYLWRIKETPSFFERRSYHENDGPDQHRRIYHVSRGRLPRGPHANGMINENIKSNDRRHEEELRDDREPENENRWQAWTTLLRELFVKSVGLMTGLWLAATRLTALLRDQSIWVFQQRRIHSAIGHEAQCAVLSHRKVLIVNQGDVVTGDSVLLALKSHALSDLLHSVERGKRKVTNSRKPIRQVEYRLDRWWPPYI